MASCSHVSHFSQHCPLKQVLNSSYTYRDQLFYLLTDQIKKLEDDRNSLQFAKAGLQDECKTLSQKVDILNELYQLNEMALRRFAIAITL